MSLSNWSADFHFYGDILPLAVELFISFVLDKAARRLFWTAMRLALNDIGSMHAFIDCFYTHTYIYIEIIRRGTRKRMTSFNFISMLGRFVISLASSATKTRKINYKVWKLRISVIYFSCFCSWWCQTYGETSEYWNKVKRCHSLNSLSLALLLLLRLRCGAIVNTIIYIHIYIYICKMAPIFRLNISF